MVKSHQVFGSIAAVSIVGLLIACCQKDSRAAANEPPLQQPETGAAASSARPAAPDHKPKRIALFNGKDLSGWKVIEASLFDQHGEVKVERGQIVIGLGNPASGIHLAKKPPRDEYEISFQARRIEGSDFFCGLTFPIRDQYCSLIIGGWGGTAVGLSNLDGMAAVENETTCFLDIKQGKWYSIRLRVADGHIRVWIDKEPKIDVEIAEHQYSIWWEQEPARPLGITTWNTKAEYKDLFMTLLQSQDTTSKRGTQP
jgi:3-keto-disaccharide hydrolase